MIYLKQQNSYKSKQQRSIFISITFSLLSQFAISVLYQRFSQTLYFDNVNLKYIFNSFFSSN